MLNTEHINPFINSVVYELTDLLQEKNINQNLTNYLYLVVIGLILKYGNDYKNDIYNIISKLTIETNYNKILKISKSFDKDDLFKDDNKIWTFYNEDNYIMCIKDDFNFNGINFLELLVKEFNQILNSLYNNVTIKDGCEIKRSGLYQEYFYDNRIVKIEGNIINEVFNILQTEEIIKLILKLRLENIECENIRIVFKDIKVIDNDNYTINDNNVLVNIFRRLYSIDEFNKMITEVLLKGNVNDLKTSIDSTLGFDAYKILDYNLTEAYIDYKEAKISNLKVYDYALRHCLLRNMVNLYIKKNYEISS